MTPKASYLFFAIPSSRQRWNYGRQFSNAEIRGVTFAMHNQNVAIKDGVQYFSIGMNAFSAAIS